MLHISLMSLFSSMDKSHIIYLERNYYGCSLRSRRKCDSQPCDLHVIVNFVDKNDTQDTRALIFDW